MSFEWTAWAADGGTYHSTEMGWKDVPARYIVIVTGRWNGTRFQESGHDTIYHDGNIHGSTEVPFVGVNLPHPDFEEVAERLMLQGLLKYGVYLPSDEYEAIWRRAHESYR